mgnify:FL=1
MIQNLWWAAGYNIVAIPLAAGVLYNYGVMLSPAFGSVLMSLSTIVVAINAKLVGRERNIQNIHRSKNRVYHPRDPGGQQK